MATTSTSMTLLDAVNECLSITGEAPITDINITGLIDVDNAKARINKTLRDVQEKGWWFNTEMEYPITPDVSGFLNIPGNTLRINPSESCGMMNVTLRGTKLYNRKTHTFTFVASDLPQDGIFKADIVLLLDFDLLPQAAKQYISIRAAREYQRRWVSADYPEKYTAQEEFLAMASLQDQDTSDGDYNMLTDNIQSRLILNRYF